MSYKVIDNFLSEDLLKKINTFIKGPDCPWYYRPQDVITSSIKENSNLKKNKNGFFCFCYYNDFAPRHNSFYEHIVPILNDLDVAAPLEARVNLNFRDIDSNESKYHTDRTYDNFLTAILYLTTCNAKTILKIENENFSIDSKENRIVIFDGNIPHKVQYQTDSHKRYVINLNYVPKHKII